MNVRLIKPELRDIAVKVEAGQRLNEADCLRLFESQELPSLGLMANWVRERRHGNRAFYIINRHINYSNLCVLDCDFCAFYRRPKQSGAYELSIAEMVEKAQRVLRLGITELHIVGGLHPTWKLDRYVEMLRALRALDERLHLKAFTATEIRHLARLSRRSIRATLAALREAGLGSLPGGGAEIFDPAVRKVICPAKETAEEWLEVHREWHRMGGHSTCTMLIGHVEKPEHRVDHLRRLRDLQDETGGFTAFVT
ncbi:MAG: radical SAM protein, partial [Verrucomicrobiae bacterium]|nr:radical SAM protein [Verrucomicrobiae bacterium]